MDTKARKAVTTALNAAANALDAAVEQKLRYNAFGSGEKQFRKLNDALIWALSNPHPSGSWSGIMIRDEAWEQHVAGIEFRARIKGNWPNEPKGDGGYFPQDLRSRRGRGQHMGRCPAHRVVNFETRAPLRAGSLVDVAITGASPHSLLGLAQTAEQALELPLVS